MAFDKNTRDQLWFFSFLVFGLVVQCITYLWRPNNIWDLVSGCLGIVAVVLCAKRNILTYAFGFAQIVTYTYLCYLEKFYAGIATNCFYFVCQIYGSYNWYLSIKGKNTLIVPTRSIKKSLLLVVTMSMIVVSLLIGVVLRFFTDDTQPFLDAFTTVPAFVAEVMMILTIREHWYFWFFVDILFVILWLRADNYCMVVQYIFWCANCIYGYTVWSHENKD